jgi:hypothetical protein
MAGFYIAAPAPRQAVGITGIAQMCVSAGHPKNVWIIPSAGAPMAALMIKTMIPRPIITTASALLSTIYLAMHWSK